MKCNYPNCRNEQALIPVVEVPTVRQSASGTWAKTDRPTYLIGAEICLQHKEGYNWGAWFGPNDWKQVQEAARDKGYIISDAERVIVRFMPLGWTPDARYLEVER